MDRQQQAFLEVLQQAVGVIQQARTEQGWTAGAVALILLFCILGLAWMVRRLCVQVDEMSRWRTNLLQGQVEETTRALTTASTEIEQFGGRIAENTFAVKDNTRAVCGLREAIQAAPCGLKVT